VIDSRHCSQCGAVGRSMGAFCGRCGWRIGIVRQSKPDLRTVTIALLIATLVASVGVALVLRGTGQSASDIGPAPSSTIAAPGSSDQGIVAASALTVSVPTGDSSDSLIDSDSSTRWSHPVGDGSIPVIEFTFSPAATLSEALFQNAREGASFARHSRVRQVEITFVGSGEVITAELPDTPGRHAVSIPFVVTEQLMIRVLEVYPGQSFDGEPPFEELTIAEIEFRALDAS